ncbi:MAG: helix-turn-helix transcriptional regulator, partial [Paracoccus sp. (in: a-proteobacteria)]
DCAEVELDRIKDGQIFVVNFGGALFVKRIQFLPGDGLMLTSSNSGYEPITVSGADRDSVRIIGRVVSSSHEW